MFVRSLLFTHIFSSVFHDFGLLCVRRKTPPRHRTSSRAQMRHLFWWGAAFAECWHLSRATQSSYLKSQLRPTSSVTDSLHPLLTETHLIASKFAFQERFPNNFYMHSREVWNYTI